MVTTCSLTSSALPAAILRRSYWKTSERGRTSSSSSPRLRWSVVAKRATGCVGKSRPLWILIAISPLRLEGFDFDSPAVAKWLTGKLAALKRYNALRISADFWSEAMTRLRETYLNAPLDAVLHPASRLCTRGRQRPPSCRPPCSGGAARGADRTGIVGAWIERASTKASYMAPCGTSTRPSASNQMMPRPTTVGALCA